MKCLWLQCVIKLECVALIFVLSFDVEMLYHLDNYLLMNQVKKHHLRVGITLQNKVSGFCPAVFWKKMCTQKWRFVVQFQHQRKFANNIIVMDVVESNSIHDKRFSWAFQTEKFYAHNKTYPYLALSIFELAFPENHSDKIDRSTISIHKYQHSRIVYYINLFIILV